ncbi:hypothetical protein MASR2M44_14250 [Bacteroidota bacterium]
MKKILLVCKSFFPEQTPRAFRATELALELKRQGHQVTILLANKPEDLTQFEGIEFHRYGPLKWKELEASKNPLVGDWKRKFGRILYWYADYPNNEVYFRVKPLLKGFSGFDLLISIAVPHELHWAIGAVRANGHRIAKTWVADCGDPFMGNRLDTVNPPFYFSFFEKRFCREADYISVPTPGSIGAYYPEFHPKFRVIPQGFDFSGIRRKPFTRGAEVPQFAYAGKVSQSGVRGLKPLMDWLRSIERPFVFHVFGPGATEQLVPLIEAGDKRFQFHQPLDRISLIYELSGMDFLLNLDNQTPFNTPSKLIDYNLTGRPVCNLFAPLPDFQLLESFLSGDSSRRMELPPLENFDIRNVAAQFLSLDSGL